MLGKAIFFVFLFVTFGGFILLQFPYLIDVTSVAFARLSLFFKENIDFFYYLKPIFRLFEHPLFQILLAVLTVGLLFKVLRGN